MECGKGGEGFKDWEQIQSPASQITIPTPQSGERGRVVIKDDFYNDGSVFPPTDHEGLPISAQPTQQPNSHPSPCSSPRSQLLRVEGFVGRLRLRFGVLSSEIVRVVSGIGCHAAGGGGFRPLGSAVAGAVSALLLSLLYFWVRRWRRLRKEEKNRLILLLKERDQKINQLLLQIAQMSEMLSTRRRVPVVRIGQLMAHGQPT